MIIKISSFEIKTGVVLLIFPFTSGSILVQGHFWVWHAPELPLEVSSHFGGCGKKKNQQYCSCLYVNDDILFIMDFTFILIFKSIVLRYYLDYQIFWLPLKLCSSLTSPLSWSWLRGPWSRGEGAVATCPPGETQIPRLPAPRICWWSSSGAPKSSEKELEVLIVGWESPPKDWREVLPK